jgi:hypothetical protein
MILMVVLIEILTGVRLLAPERPFAIFLCDEGLNLSPGFAILRAAGLDQRRWQDSRGSFYS